MPVDLDVGDAVVVDKAPDDRPQLIQSAAALLLCLVLGLFYGPINLFNIANSTRTEIASTERAFHLARP